MRKRIYCPLCGAKLRGGVLCQLPEHGAPDEDDEYINICFSHCYTCKYKLDFNGEIRCHYGWIKHQEKLKREKQERLNKMQKQKKDEQKKTYKGWVCRKQSDYWR